MQLNNLHFNPLGTVVRKNILGHRNYILRMTSSDRVFSPLSFFLLSGEKSLYNLNVGEKKEKDTHTNGRTDGRYQLNYLPRFAVDVISPDCCHL